jgi:putative intracellular protease/amidase/YHS domain-containing protein
MNRRDLLKRSATLGLASAIPALAALAGSDNKSQQTQSAARPDAAADRPSPLPDPTAGRLPAAFVLGPGAVVLDFCGPLEVFSDASTKDGKPLFAPYMVAATRDSVTVGGGMKVVPDYTFKTAPQPKIIVIPAMDRVAASLEMYEWIRSASKATDLTMSVCNGAFVLAKTGLLSGKSATCHHGGYFRFATEFPDVHLKRGARFVEDGDLASAGGISSGIDLALRVVERYVGKEAAMQVADGMEYQGKGWLDPNSNEAYATLPVSTDGHPMCLVCGMEADKSIRSSHNGKTYYFCSDAEKDVFDKHPEVIDRFLAEDLKQTGK